MSEPVSRTSRCGLQLYRFQDFPEQLLEVGYRDLWQHLDGPSLFFIPGRDPRPLFVSVLLHGNEDTGWVAVQNVLRKHLGTGHELARRMILFVGNIAAAKSNVRTLDNQADYNRSWPGTRYPEAAESALMSEVVEAVAAEQPFASIDIHNNTGNNPHYGCVNRLDEKCLHLARLFSRTVVFFTRPVGVQSAAMARICPAVTVECGVPGTPAAADHAAEFVEAALSLAEFPQHPVPEHDIDLLQTAVIVRVPPDASFSYDGSDADFRFLQDIDHLNFSELEPGTAFGSLGATMDRRLVVVPGGELDIDPESYITYDDGKILLAEAVIPAMLTRDPRAVRLDCLGYLMHRVDRTGKRTETR